jgi:hypothetical protein
VDSGPFATTDMRSYRTTVEHLRTLNMSAPSLDDVQDVGGVLAACRATYKTEGLKSMREIPSGSVNFAWSQAVLEHIRRDEFREFMGELRRVLSADGACSHRVDLKDHLGGALDNLRFPADLWEADWMARSGFYTNRFRYSEMLDVFQSVGFDIDIVRVDRWKALPTPRSRMALAFRELDDDELLVSAFDVVLRPSKRPKQISTVHCVDATASPN